MKDPDGFLRSVHVSFASFLTPSRPAILDPEHRVRINYETFYFATEAEKRRFLRNAVSLCGLLTDPVTERRFRPRPNSKQTTRDGVLYLFETEDSYREFLQMPSMYAQPHPTMANASSTAAPAAPSTTSAPLGP